MPREHYSELLVLIAVARERSFTRAAAELGMSQSMLSHTIQSLEKRLGVRLLTRTTRSVSVTEAGERLLQVVVPRFKDMEMALQSVADSTSVPAGTVRITATDYVIDTLLWPKLSEILPAYPLIKVELSADDTLIDIVQGRYDFGVRLGDEPTKDTSAVRIGPDLRFALVGAPSYLAIRPLPKSPQDLGIHECINLGLSARGNLYAWEFKKGGQEMNAQVDGRLVFNGIRQVVNAALSGFGLAYVPEELVKPHLDSGRLLPVLNEWWREFPGYHLHYSNRHELSRATQVLIEGLRYKK
jgi:DNA-binding transcriptional LysR family regulator